MRKNNFQIVLTSLILFSILQFGFLHVSFMFARYMPFDWSSYTVALGFELSVFSISIANGMNDRFNRWFKFTISFSLLVTTIANISEAYRYFYIEIPILNMSFIIEMVILIFANLAISFVGMAQAEILGELIEKRRKNKNKAAKIVMAKVNNDNFGLADIERRIQILKQFETAFNEKIAPPLRSQLILNYNVSAKVIQNDFQWMIDQGQIIKTGKKYIYNDANSLNIHSK